MEGSWQDPERVSWYVLCSIIDTDNRSDARWNGSDHPWTWTRTHGFFALMGGFVLQDGVEQTALGHRYYSPDLQLLKTKEIMNPRISEKQISGRSKSDGLGNALLVLQLSWFILQVVARAANKLAITLLEIDTLALATLSLPLFFFWWSKPMAPECHHIFYTSTVSQRAPERNQRVRSVTISSTKNSHDDDFPITRSGSWLAEIFGKVLDDESIRVLLIVWVVFGGLHLLAWDFQFPSQAEKIIWRVASFALIATPCCFFLADKMHLISGNTDYALIGVGVVARFILLVLMFASLRDIPASAHQTVSWTSYVPHL
ncbi:hypothetical protein PAXINDRAFT_115673 [Paxillus involutus ATCC 200175]|uniref:Uncharacterized protein n=1 Tax=Paxillus involutus ATCC 200175 TaxID=664439 RepID=A0A0C9U5E2_PAXIN|nr:hypothetical protein PAXINDRAFT_115673 [Paxillus involutus ATCC 200175]